MSGHPHLSEVIPHIQLPESAGPRLPFPVFSNHVNGVCALQVREGSLFMFRYTGSPNTIPNVTRFELPKPSGKEPIICMAIFERAANDYGLITITGDAETNTQVSLYCVRITDEGKFTLDLISNPPKTFSLIASDIKPYFVCADESSETLLFIGGDSETYSAVGTFAVSELLRSSSSIEFSHCQPLPRPRAVGSKDCFYICSAFGEMYRYKKGGRNNKLTLIRSDIQTSFSGPSSMTLVSTGLFVGSRVGDSVLYPFNISEPITIIVRSVGPISDFSPIDDLNSITTIGGVGNSARINRIITSGIGCYSLESNYPNQKYEKLFVVNDSVLIVSSPVQSRLYKFRIQQESLLLTELEGVIPRKILAASDSFLVSAEGVFDLKASKVVWTSPVPITACDIDKDFMVLIGSGRSVFLFSHGKFESESHPFPDDEIACIATRGKRTVFGLTRTVVIDSKIIWSSDSLGPNSLKWIDNTAVAIGLRDGTVVVVDVDSGESRIFPGGILPVTLGGSDVSIFISGDKPGCLIRDNGLERIDIVNGRSGGIDMMSSMQVLRSAESTVLVYLDHSGCINAATIRLDKTRESHIQRSATLGDQVPILVGIEQRQSEFMVGVTHSESANSQDNIVFVDSKKLQKGLNRIKLPPGERVSCMCIGRIATDTSHFDGDEVVVVGTMSENDGREPIEGKLILLENELLTDDVSTIMMLCEDGTGPAGPVTCTIIVNGFLIATAGRTVSVFKRGSQSLVHCASLDVDYYLTCLDAQVAGSKLYLLTGDLSRSVTLLELSENLLTVIGKDWTPAAVTKVCFIDSEKFAFADNLGNLYIASLLDPPSQRIERIEGLSLGSVVTAMRRIDGRVKVGLENGSVLELIECEPSEIELPENTMVGHVYDPSRDQSQIPILRYEEN